MCETSTKVFILEVMGRHAGWIAAAGALAQDAPVIRRTSFCCRRCRSRNRSFCAKVKATVAKNGYLRDCRVRRHHYADGTFVADAGSKDAFGHTQLGGVAPTIAQMIKDKLGYKYHWAVADYLQRAARHIALED